MDYDTDIDITESIKTLGVSEELLEREKEYRRKNKELQFKSQEAVKKAEAFVEEGKQALKRTTSQPAISAAAAEDHHGPIQPRPVTHKIEKRNNTLELKPARPKSQQQELRFEMSDWGQKQQDHPSGIESANKFLRTKLQMLQQDFDNVLADRNSKESKIQQLDESLKNAEDEKKKMSKNVQNLQNQLEKLRKTNEELKKSNSEAESELLIMKKEIDDYDRNKKHTVSEANAKDLKLNRALQDIEKYKGLLAKASLDSKEQMESIKKNADKLFNENNKLAKQKQDLLAAFKKQAQLIEVLKRQKVHLESLKLLEFSEEEFMKVLNLEPPQ